ncbi:putative arabinosyltransferase ARAD1 [Heracleum sosnowskyi]|uniref:Arabinosyltransferase ARAD1 n=1 Tax=Heracleum sosnowskyi TaxID=360622 RepID=A0AAD8JJ82_9APIA|nr:putative arabinosyltransferase ARAD1 [Heracleum sosnowskyi]
MAFLVIIILTFSILKGGVDVRSSFSSITLTSSNTTTNCATSSSTQLKVYMYDLPKRFNIGMLIKTPYQDLPPVTVQTLPPWPKNGLKQQHSVEYWMMASLLDTPIGDDGSNREAVRVFDPNLADVFFLPFFSSLSFNTHGHNMTDPDTKFDKQLQVDVLKFLRESDHWKRSSGRDHVIPMHHPNAFRFYREEVNASILIVADFGRYSKVLSNLSKDVVAPYVHVVDSFMDDNSSDPYESRKTLLFFRGRTERKDGGKVRSKLVPILKDIEDVVYENSFVTEEGINMSIHGMRLSKFCLHPAGDTPSSCRLFDAIVSHCVPVIVSDNIELPYEDELDYTEFSVVFSVEEALTKDYMVNQLRQISKEKWLNMWRLLKQIAHHYEFQYPPKKEDAVNMLWRQIKHKVPATKLAVHRTRRLKVPDWWRRKR